MADQAAHLPIHVVIPDTQVKPGVRLDHLDWIGKYIAEKFAGRSQVRVIHLGDHWDMPSLSSYDKKGGKKMEGRRYAHDIDAGNEGFERLSKPIERAMSRTRAAGPWTPELIYLRGNHEHRIVRAAEENAQLDGTISLDDTDTRGWDVHDFLMPVTVDGVTYSHYFYNPNTGRPVAGQIETRIKVIGRTFTQGHQQVSMYGMIPGWTPDGLPTMRHGLVAGACYLHDEDYMGPQGNAYWRGIIVKYAVNGGTYDPKFVSLDSLCRRYEGVSLAEFVPGIGTGRCAA